MDNETQSEIHPPQLLGHKVHTINVPQEYLYTSLPTWGDPYCLLLQPQLLLIQPVLLLTATQSLVSIFSLGYVGTSFLVKSLVWVVTRCHYSYLCKL